MVAKPRKRPSPKAPPRKSAQGRRAGPGERFLVTHGDTLVESIDEALACLQDIVEMLAADFDRKGEGGFGGQDMAVWRSGQLVAVVRRDHGGKPKAMVFDDAD